MRTDMAAMRHRVSLHTGLFLVLLLLTYCATDLTEPTEQERYVAVCGNCHQAPDPAELPKEVWTKSVLPEMAARMGLVTYGYDPATVLGEAEFALASANGQYPEVPTITYDEWESVRAYILAQAPDTLPLVPVPELAALTEFSVRALRMEDKGGALVSYLSAQDGQLIAGDGYGSLATFSAGQERTITQRVILSQGRLPLTHYQSRPDGDLLLEIGNIYPTEAHNGTLYRLQPNGSRTVVADSLHRPVYFLAEDLDGDGTDEIIVCEYGNYTGALTLLRVNSQGSYTRQRLSGVAGSIRVVAQDMNGDGLKDLVSLHAQGDEGVDVYYQAAGGSFERQPLLHFSPVWGTSWFELVDFDGDGDQDIVTAHGDNADYSNVRKPYHGVRIYENAGDDVYSLRYFQSLPGATRVVVRDFDRDGDLDLAVACNFADYARDPEAAFVYLEQTGDAELAFTPRTTPAAADGRWLILEAGDYDGDGDDDLALGSFTLNPAPVPADVAERWRGDSVDVVVLENRMR